MVRIACAVLLIGVAAVSSAACSQRETSDEFLSDGRAIDDADVLAPEAEFLDEVVMPDVAVDELDSEEEFVGCPVVRWKLEQSDAEKMNGKPCHTSVKCGWFEPCMCTAWCDCLQGVWVCDSVCDDSCLDDVKDAL